MPSTLALRRRIKTAQNISKTTRAMQMIAASKLKRAQQAVLASRPYVEKLTDLTQVLAPAKGESMDTLHPFLQQRHTTGKTLFIVISPDKGLCGGLNTNIYKEYFKYNKDEKNYFVTVGKKIENIAGPTTKNLIASFHAGTTLPSFAMVEPIATIVNDYYLSGKVDSVKIITTHFTSVFSQTPAIIDLLPVILQNDETMKDKQAVYTLIEPAPAELLPSLLKRYIDMTIYQQLLESYASFNAAQMIAMQNATNNATDIVSDLTLLYNKLRQEKITNEILDISGAAAALANS